MKTHALKLSFFSCPASCWQLTLILLIWPLTYLCSGGAITNSVPWTDNFETYANLTPLINGTNGWYSSPSSSETSIVQNVVFNSGSQAAQISVGDMLENRFSSRAGRNVKLVMYILPQLATSSVNPVISSTVAAQFFINSNGYFVVGNGSSWNVATGMPSGTARSITNINGSTNFVQLQLHLQYNTHTWDLKAWTNGVLVASTNYLRFATNLNSFSGFTIYNGSITSYVDDISVSRFEGPAKVNGVSFDTIRRIDGALPDGKINGVNAQ